MNISGAIKLNFWMLFRNTLPWTETHFAKWNSWQFNMLHKINFPCSSVSTSTRACACKMHSNQKMFGACLAVNKCEIDNRNDFLNLYANNAIRECFSVLSMLCWLVDCSDSFSIHSIQRAYIAGAHHSHHSAIARVHVLRISSPSRPSAKWAHKNPQSRTIPRGKRNFISITFILAGPRTISNCIFMIRNDAWIKFLCTKMWGDAEVCSMDEPILQHSRRWPQERRCRR